MLAFIAALITTSSAFADPVGATVLELNGPVSVSLCSAALVDLGNSDDDTAYLLSAGHCPQFPYLVDPGKAYAMEGNHWPKTYGYPSGSTLNTPSSIEIARLEYATLTNTDVAIFRTTKTVRDFRTGGYRVFQLGKQLPAPGTKLRVTSAYWKQTQICTVDRILRTNADELEVDPTSSTKYTFRDSALFDSKCIIRTGWSGSPAFDDREGKIYGVTSRFVNPATTKHSIFAGIMNLMRFMSFSAVDFDSGVLVTSNLTDLNACIGSKGELQLNARGCELPRIDPNAVPQAPAPKPTPPPSGSFWPKLKKKPVIIQ